MKQVFVGFLLYLSFSCNAQKDTLEFAIYFGNDFQNDSVTILINGVTVAKNIKLRQTMISPQNLIIKQENGKLIVWPYYETKRILKKIPYESSILNLDIKTNQNWKNYKFNIRGGRFFYPKYSFLRAGWSVMKILRITQSTNGPLMF